MTRSCFGWFVSIVATLTSSYVLQTQAFLTLDVSLLKSDPVEQKFCSTSRKNTADSNLHDSDLDTTCSISRRKAVQNIIIPTFLIPMIMLPSTRTVYADDLVQAFPTLSSSSVTVPLEFTGSELLVYYRVDGSLFRAVVDTGSPFLMIPGSCGVNTRQKSGCYKEQGRPSGLKETYEQFDGFEGKVEWRQSNAISFVNATSGSTLMSRTPEVIFGVASESILGGPGGVFFGLIRDTETRIRPSFLSQTSVQAIDLDLRSPTNKFLTLSQTPIIPRVHNYYRSPSNGIIRLSNDLRRKYGAPVSHYAARAHSIVVNGYPLSIPTSPSSSSSRREQPIYVIFDTGVTGMIVSEDLLEERYKTARRRKEKSLWGHVEISFANEAYKDIARTEKLDSDSEMEVSMENVNNKAVILSAEKPLTTSFDPSQSWKKFRRSSLVVIGLSFLNGNRLTIDIDEERLFFEKGEIL